MGERVTPALMQRFRERSATNGIVEKVDLPDVPTRVVRPHLIPFTGNVHIGMGRVSKRSVVAKRFAKLKF
jgi:hypothetical protein